MWSEIKTCSHQASDKSLTLCWHGDSEDKGNNGAPHLRASTGQVGVFWFELWGM